MQADRFAVAETLAFVDATELNRQVFLQHVSRDNRRKTKHIDAAVQLIETGAVPADDYELWLAGLQAYQPRIGRALMTAAQQAGTTFSTQQAEQLVAWAIYGQEPAVTAYLLRFSVDPNALISVDDKPPKTLLWKIVDSSNQRAYANLIPLLQAGADPNVTSGTGGPDALGSLLFRGCAADVVAAMVTHGATVDKNIELYLRANRPGEPDRIRALVSAAPDPWLFHQAIVRMGEANDEQSLRALVEYLAQASPLKEWQKNTLLIELIQLRHHQTLVLLSEHGFDIGAARRHGWTLQQEIAVMAALARPEEAEALAVMRGLGSKRISI